MGAAINLGNQRFARLTVIEVVPRTKRTGGVRWRCRCDCGREVVVNAGCLRGGHTRSCGCIRSASLTKHGLSGAPEYFAWKHMHYRCSNPGHRAFRHYGGRGIAVCERWQSLAVFLEDMGSRPSPQHTIERIDNDGDYEPNNCCWALPIAQARNRRTNRYVAIDGETLTFTEWCGRYGIGANAAMERTKRGWSDLDAIRLPVGSKKPKP